MSATTDEDVSLKAILARIDRDLAESSKLREESAKFVAEQRKLIAEAGKLDRDRKLSPYLLGASVMGGLIVAFANHLWR